MFFDKYKLGSELFGTKRAEAPARKSTTSTIYGTAVADSADGKVEVVIDGDVTPAPGGTNTVTLPTSPSVKKGDVVAITLVGGTAKSPMVTANPGSGDAADEYARTAAQAAAAAQASAGEAADAAATAQDAAATALVGLSDVENVVGTVTWLAEHGTYHRTGDYGVQPDADYFTNGVYGLPEDVEGYVGEAVTLPSNIPYRAGWAFQGWSAARGATTADYQPGGTYEPTSEADTLYAVWARPSGNTMDWITFEHNHGRGALNYISNMPSDIYDAGDYAVGDVLEIPEIPIYDPADTVSKHVALLDVFSGWGAVNTSTTDIIPGGSATLTDTQIQFFAQWATEYRGLTLCLYPNGADGDVTTQQIPLGEYGTVPECPFELGDYTFVAWCTNSGGTGTFYKPGDSILATARTTLALYAIWRSDAADAAALTFNRGVSGRAAARYQGLPDNITTSDGYCVGDVIQLPDTVPYFVPNTSYPNPAYFMGWSTSYTGAVWWPDKTAEYQPGDYYRISSTTQTLYAVWTARGADEPTEATVTFDASATDYSHVMNLLDAQVRDYYELSLDASVQSYIASHLAQTDHGLNLMVDSTSLRVHLGTIDGTYAMGLYVIDASGVPVARFTANGAVIGKATGAMHVELTSDRLSFIDAKGTSVAYIEVDSSTGFSVMYITRSVVVEDMTFGDWKWYQRANGNMALRWLGA